MISIASLTGLSSGPEKSPDSINPIFKGIAGEAAQSMVHMVDEAATKGEAQINKIYQLDQIAEQTQQLDKVAEVSAAAAVQQAQRTAQAAPVAETLMRTSAATEASPSSEATPSKFTAFPAPSPQTPPAQNTGLDPNAVYRSLDTAYEEAA